MEEELISFETAKLAILKGFNSECLYFYTKPNSKMFGIDEHNRAYSIKNVSKKIYKCGEQAALNIESVYFAPTQSLLQKWLREVHNINISIGNVYSEYTDWSYAIGVENKGIIVPFRSDDTQFKTYEEALEIGLQKALKLI